MLTTDSDEQLREHGQRILNALRENRPLSASDLSLVSSLKDVAERRAHRMVIIYGTLLFIILCSILSTQWLLGIKNEAVDVTLVGGLFLAFFVQLIWLNSGGRDYYNHEIMHHLYHLTCRKCEIKMKHLNHRLIESKHCPHCDASLSEVFLP